MKPEDLARIKTDPSPIIRMGKVSEPKWPTDNGTRWHYAVWANRRAPHRAPACWIANGFWTKWEGFAAEPGVLHGHTVNRGQVNCGECLAMMGIA